MWVTLEGLPEQIESTQHPLFLAGMSNRSCSKVKVIGGEIVRPPLG